MNSVTSLSLQKNLSKLNVGWFSFTCCEDSTILLTELLNYHFDNWKKLVNFKYIKALKSKNDMTNLDIAFVEGAISAKIQEDEVLKIRENSKYVIAIGACACTGLPSASRNAFSDKEKDEKVTWFMNQFKYNEKVKKLEEVIKIDDKVEGCPMDVNSFIKILDKYLKIFKLI